MPNRVLRDWTNSERFDELSAEAEVFFTRLIMKADDFGGFYGNTKLLKSHLYPLKDFKHSEIKPWILECQEIGVIIYYKVEGKKYIRINEFGQRTRIMRSKFPDPVNNPPSHDGHMTVKRPLETKPKPNQTETKPKLETETLLLSLSEESELSYNQQVAWSFWKLFKSIKNEEGLATEKLDRAKLSLWTSDARKLVELDKRTDEQLKIVWKHVKNDTEFWRSTVSSISGVRNNFDKIFLAAKKKPQGKTTDAEWQKYYAEVAARMNGTGTL